MHMNDRLGGMRRQYGTDILLERNSPDSPLQLLRIWLHDAVVHEQPPVEANAMFLATVDAEDQPHCRVVLLKGVDERGLVFYSHQGSAKGQELAGNPRAALAFHWPTLERQLRIEGMVEGRLKVVPFPMSRASCDALPEPAEAPASRVPPPAD